MKNLFVLIFLVLALACSDACSSKMVRGEKLDNPKTSLEKSQELRTFENNQNEASNDSERFVGYVTIKGTSNFPMTVFTTTKGDKSYILKGDDILLRELKIMSGVAVEIKGEIINSGKPLQSITVKSYRLVPDKTGEVAFIGKVESVGKVLNRENGSRYLLQGIPNQFYEGRVGSLIWVIGKEITKWDIVVTRFGLLEASGDNEKFK